jgi:SMP-30/Gluconolactonase/LRE-like region
VFRVELLVDARKELGEGPLCDVNEHRLYWIDSHGKAIHRCDARQDVRILECEHIASLVCVRTGSRSSACAAVSTFSTSRREKCGRSLTPRPIFAARGWNDGKVDRQGRFVAGGTDYGEREPLAPPVDSITSVMFGGSELDMLYVASMARPFRGRRRQEREAGGPYTHSRRPNLPAMLSAKQVEMIFVEFYKMAKGGDVGHILETAPMAPFASKDEFIAWAQTALPSRRGNPDIWEWPEAVRAIDQEGSELFRWTLWDQLQAGKPIVNAHRS